MSAEKKENPAALSVEDLRQQYAVYELDGEVGWTVHVSTVHRLIQEAYQRGREEGGLM